MAKRNTSDWLPRVLFESFLIVISILVALALDQWRDKRQDDEMVRQALLNFVSEIDQNRIRIEADASFNQGLLEVLEEQYRQPDALAVDNFVMMVESYAPNVLQTTAWDTALATGSLAKMEYNLVSALSMTYTEQSRYQAVTRTGMADVLDPQSLSEEQMKSTVFSAIRYLRDVTAMESGLNDIYSAVSPLIHAEIGSEITETGSIVSTND